MATDIDIVRNDQNFALNFTIKDASLTVVDLTGVSTIKLKIQKYETSTLFATITGTPVLPYTSGLCTFIVGAQFVNQVGDYMAEIEITYLSGEVITAPNIKIHVIEDLPK